MKRIAKEATGDTDTSVDRGHRIPPSTADTGYLRRPRTPDTSGDYEDTDWEELAAFTNDFAGFVEGRLGVAPTTTDTQPMYRSAI